MNQSIIKMLLLTVLLINSTLSLYKCCRAVDGPDIIIKGFDNINICSDEKYTQKDGNQIAYINEPVQGSDSERKIACDQIADVYKVESNDRRIIL